MPSVRSLFLVALALASAAHGTSFPAAPAAPELVLSVVMSAAVVGNNPPSLKLDDVLTDLFACSR